jgi:hypothetical protein
MLTFPIRRFRLRTVLPYPRGPMYCPRPAVPLKVIGPSGSTQRVAMVDSGADSSVFPTSIAILLEVDLAKAYLGSAVGVGTGSVGVRYARVILELDDGQSSCRWRTYVGFAPVRHALFGVIGGLEYFKSTFDYAAQELALLPQANLPATNDQVPDSKTKAHYFSPMQYR